MKTTLPLLTLAAALLAGCAATVPVKGIVADRSIAEARIKAPIGEECAPILSWWNDDLTYGNKRRSERHNGLDLIAPTGTHVIAAAPGLVIASYNDSFAGETVFIFHGLDIYGNQVLSEYVHLSDRVVKKGDLVMRGQKIGLSGFTGAGAGNDGPHLHFGARLFPIESPYDLHDRETMSAVEKFSWRRRFVSPVPLIYPTAKHAHVAPETFPAYKPATDYGDSNWSTTKNFTGFTFPVSCAGLK